MKIYDFHIFSNVFMHKMHENFMCFAHKSLVKIYENHRFSYILREPFRYGCTHGENGCTDDTCHAAFIKKFMLDDIVYDGIPQFETYTDFCSGIMKLNCKWYCMCNNQQFDCPNAFYKHDITECTYDK